MPRGPRRRSSSGIYHILLRGTNKQQIFHDERDYQTFLEGLRKYHKLCNFELFAYCLMSNHLHLLLRENAQGEPVDKIMRRLGTWYVYRYNRRYERSGALFEGRYKSEAVENDNELITVLRCIHRNPVKAGILASPALYPYSSYASYLPEKPDELVDTQVLLALVPKEEIAAWHEYDDKAECLDVAERAKRLSISDEKAMQVMKWACGTANPEVFLHLSDLRRASVIQRMRKAGASLNQIVRLTGTSMALVRKAIG
jgi:REP element-mobilizing transposase RayT